MNKKTFPPEFIKFIILVLISIGTTYSGSDMVSSLWYIGMLVWYYLSKNEAFWAAYFLVTVDGFMSVLGLYSATISILPGLPGVEVAQFYIALTIIKATFQQSSVRIFFKNFLRIMFFYAAFLIVYGQLTGFGGETKEYFRIFKLTLPLLLLYSLPRLIRNFEDYEFLMGYIFLVMILGFITQISSLLFHFAPSNYLVIRPQEEEESEIFRTFYNTAITLMSMFGATFFMNFSGRNYFSSRYLNIVLLSAFGMALLSATRGWILSFGFIMIMNFTVINRVNPRRLAGFVIALALLLVIGLSNEKVKEQIDYSIERFETLEALIGGDVTAEGTLQRLDERGPRVMNQFEKSPVIGFGYSNIYKDYHDSHVGNQNILLYSGIIGMALIAGFLLFICLVFLQRYFKSPANSIYRKPYLTFVVFLLGWFMLHSSSGQQFGFLGLPVQMLPQAIFFSMAVMFYNLEHKAETERAMAYYLARRNSLQKMQVPEH